MPTNRHPNDSGDLLDASVESLLNLEEPIRQIHSALSLVVFIRLHETKWSESWQKAMRKLFKGKPQTADVVSINCARHKSGRYPHSGISYPACSNHSTADMVSTNCAKEAQGRRNKKKGKAPGCRRGEYQLCQAQVWPISTKWHFVSSILKPLNCGHGEY